MIIYLESDLGSYRIKSESRGMSARPKSVNICGDRIEWRQTDSPSIHSYLILSPDKEIKHSAPHSHDLFLTSGSVIKCYNEGEDVKVSFLYDDPCIRCRCLNQEIVCERDQRQDLGTSAVCSHFNKCSHNGKTYKVCHHSNPIPSLTYFSVCSLERHGETELVHFALALRERSSARQKFADRARNAPQTSTWYTQGSVVLRAKKTTENAAWRKGNWPVLMDVRLPLGASAIMSWLETVRIEHFPSISYMKSILLVTHQEDMKSQRIILHLSCPS